MTTVTLTETPLGKKRPKPANEGVSQPQEPLTGDRIELQAPHDWVERLDRAAAALGMSRSAYIRMACTRQMNLDARHQSGSLDEN
jgi:hypothetical protein